MMKPVALAACVIALCGTVLAAGPQKWFNGGIGPDWPKDASMYGGTWCDGAEERAKMSRGALHISADDDEPLEFTATHPKPLGVDGAATSVDITFRCAFQPFSLSELPEMPEDAKGAVILVTEDDPDDAPGGTLYYAAYDDETEKNSWKTTGLAARTNDFVRFTMRISRLAPGFLGVEYSIMGNAFSASILSSDTVVHLAGYTGIGRADELAAESMGDKYKIGDATYADFESMNAAMQDGDTVTMLMNDTLPAGAELSKAVAFLVGECVLSAQTGGRLTIAADDTFAADAAANLPPFHIRADCVLTLPAGTAFGAYSLTGEDYAFVVIGDEGWLRYEGKWQKSYLVTMRFYYPGYFESVAETLYGPFGRKLQSGRLDSYLESVYEDEYAQGFYWDGYTKQCIEGTHWFDGTWSDADGNLIDFPKHYTAGEFYPNSTAIVYRIEYMNMVKGAVNPNPTGYTIDTRFDLGDASADGWAFTGWTDADGNPVTEIDPLELGRESECLYDLTLYANWSQKTSESPQPKTAAVVPGELAAYYDTPEAAQSAVEAFNADKASHVLAPAGFTGSVADYAANFIAVANGSAMTIKVTEAARENLASRVSDSTLAVAEDLMNPAVETVTVRNAEPGFYYSVLVGTTVGDVTKEGGRVLAQEPTVELDKPNIGPVGKAFYKIGAALKP